MDIPYLMTKLADDSKGIIESKIKTLSFPEKDLNNEILNIFMIFDLDNQCIRFDTETYTQELSENQYVYIGNNPAASPQIYAVKKHSDIKYHIKKNKALMHNIEKILPESNLKTLFSECRTAELFSENGINLSKIKAKDDTLKFTSENDNIFCGDEKLSPDKFFQLILGAGKTQKFALLIPAIYKGGSKTVISLDEMYRKTIENTFSSDSSSSKQGICHICGKLGDIEPNLNFGRSSVSKVFVTTTINYANNLSKNNYTTNYSVCKDCYSKMLQSENTLMGDYSVRIAGETAVLLFEGIDTNFNQSDIDKIKGDIDFAFNSKEASEWSEEQLATIIDDIGSQLYQFSIVFYVTDGKSMRVIKTIDSISSMRFAHVMTTFAQCRKKINKNINEKNNKPIFFSLGNVYRIIPVANDKKGSQLNVKRVLDLYSAIMKGERVDKSVIYDYACEALDRGYKQIRSKRTDTYKNLSEISKQLYIKYSHEYNRFDNYAANTVYKYLMLFDALEKLKIIDRKVYKMENENNTQALGFLSDYESFLDKQEFSPAQRGLFYLGCLINQIGYAQCKQGHEKKPILDKITYQGMTHQDVLRLYLDALDKTRQYKSHINMYLCDGFENRIHHYLGNLEESKLLNDKENVFFIMSGYAYCVKNIKKNDNEEDENND